MSIKANFCQVGLTVFMDSDLLLYQEKNKQQTIPPCKLLFVHGHQSKQGSIFPTVMNISGYKSIPTDLQQTKSIPVHTSPETSSSIQRVQQYIMCESQVKKKAQISAIVDLLVKDSSDRLKFSLTYVLLKNIIFLRMSSASIWWLLVLLLLFWGFVCFTFSLEILPTYAFWLTFPFIMKTFCKCSRSRRGIGCFLHVYLYSHVLPIYAFRHRC